MSKEHLAIASVPIQRWRTVLEPEKALKTGTIFPELNKPFFAAQESALSEPKSPVIKKSPASNEAQGRESMMLCIQEVSFTLDDIRLYLDTHPEDKEGLSLLKACVKERKRLLREFALKFFPLTADCMADIYEEKPDTECYCWQKGPMPWEGACV